MREEVSGSARPLLSLAAAEATKRAAKATVAYPLNEPTNAPLKNQINNNNGQQKIVVSVVVLIRTLASMGVSGR